MTSPKPKPGSAEAVAAGCICPRMDNGRGRGYMGIEGVYVTREECPVHDPRTIEIKEEPIK